jgi:hypothetical protein
MSRASAALYVGRAIVAVAGLLLGAMVGFVIAVMTGLLPFSC